MGIDIDNRPHMTEMYRGLPLVPADIYDHYKGCLWHAWNDRAKGERAAAYPETDGLEIHVHNWIICGKDPQRADEAQALINRQWSQWRRIDARFHREYDRTEHRRHGPTFRPLWCAYCRTA